MTRQRQSFTPGCRDAKSSATPLETVTIRSGDVYIGFFDPVNDGAALVAVGGGAVGDSYFGGSTDPSGYFPDTIDNYMIRGAGGPVPAGSLVIDWNPSCNEATTPGQDYAVYRGDFDRLLIRPVHPLLQILASGLSLSAIGEFLRRRLGFGEMVLHDADGGIIARADTLRQLERLLPELPEEVLADHLRRIGTGIVADLLLDNSPVEVVDAKGKCNLGNFQAEHDPVRLDMPEIIEIDPADSQSLERIDTTDPSGSRHPRVIRLKSQRDKRLETAGPVLQFAQPGQVIDPVGKIIQCVLSQFSCSQLQAVKPEFFTQDLIR